MSEFLQSTRSQIEACEHGIRETLFSALERREVAGFSGDEVSALSALAVHNLFGDDVEIFILSSDSPVRERFSRVQSSVDTFSEAAMAAPDVRKVVVATLRVKNSYGEPVRVEDLLDDAERSRIAKLLDRYGAEFPEAPTPAEYLALAEVFIGGADSVRNLEAALRPESVPDRKPSE